MKRVEIIIPDRKLRDANEVIRDANTGGMSYYRIEGRGGIKAEYASGTYHIPEFIPRIKVEVVVNDEQVEELVNNLLDRLGDELGVKIFIVDVHYYIGRSKRNDITDNRSGLRDIERQMLLNVFLLFMCEKSIVHLIIDLNSGIQEPHGNEEGTVLDCFPDYSKFYLFSHLT